MAAKYIEDVVSGEVKPDATRLKAAMYLVDKVLPTQKPTDEQGDQTETNTLRIVIGGDD